MCCTTSKRCAAQCTTFKRCAAQCTTSKRCAAQCTTSRRCAAQCTTFKRCAAQCTTFKQLCTNRNNAKLLTSRDLKNVIFYSRHAKQDKIKEAVKELYVRSYPKFRICGGLVVSVPDSRLPVPGLKLGLPSVRPEGRQIAL